MEEKKLDQYINELNSGRIPKDHKKAMSEGEYGKLMETVRKVKTMREVEYPDAMFEKRLMDSLAAELPTKKRETRNRIFRWRRTAILIASAAAAAILLFTAIDRILPEKNTDIVYAMEKAMKEVIAYHGIIEVTETNELGETMTQSKREVWADKKGSYYIKELTGTSAGLVTANNGEQKWQLRPEEKASYLFATFPDPYRFTFELGGEIDDVTKALTVRIIGPETISGRESTKLEVTPDGGDTYYLWVDNETDLPLQRQTAMQNAIQVKVSYRSIEFLEEIPEELLVYAMPKGYTEVATNPEQTVATLEEAAELTGFTPVLPEIMPDGYTLDRVAVDQEADLLKCYYTTLDKAKIVLFTQTEAAEEFTPASSAILGTVKEHQAEIITAMPTLFIRWQDNGMEFNVIGDVDIAELAAFAEAISGGEVVIPDGSDEAVKEPQVKVEVDMEAEENEQKSVDAGHSPWKLDPVFVTQVYASLLLSPEGIVGDYPIAYGDITIISNDGTDAVAEINDVKSIAKYVYLKRLIRQDDTGIWSVVGYDTAR
jgi:outer membrane lipoprotein-sorting protein